MGTHVKSGEGHGDGLDTSVIQLISANGIVASNKIGIPNCFIYFRSKMSCLYNTVGDPLYRYRIVLTMTVLAAVSPTRRYRNPLTAADHEG